MFYRYEHYMSILHMALIVAIVHLKQPEYSFYYNKFIHCKV